MRPYIRLTYLGSAMIAGSFLFLAPTGLRADAKAGKETFQTYCAQCHGADGSGNTIMGSSLHAADLRSAEVQKLTTPALIKVVQDGKNDKMPPFKDKLSDEEVKDAVAYVRTFAKKPAK